MHMETANDHLPVKVELKMSDIKVNAPNVELLKEKVIASIDTLPRDAQEYSLVGVCVQVLPLESF